MQEPPTPMWQLLWAKSDPFHPLWKHMLDVAAVCGQLISHFGAIDDIPKGYCLLTAALHDIGKADPFFQNKNETQKKRLQDHGIPLPHYQEEYLHSIRSYKFADDYLREEQGWDEYAADVAAKALLGHHGSFRRSGCEEDEEYWRELRKDLADNIAGILLNKDESPPQEFRDSSAAGAKLVGLIVLADWIASNEELYHYHSLNNKSDDLREYWSLAQQEAARSVDALAFGRSTYVQCNGKLLFRDVWPGLNDLKPSQRVLEEECARGVPPGLVIIEAPMGEGKTESAIYLSEYWRQGYGIGGAYIALPTMATSNSMYSRYSEFLKDRRPESVGPRLVHGMAWLLDDIAPNSRPEVYSEQDTDKLIARQWFAPSRRALLSPEGVGTVDQVLSAALNIKFGFLRLLGLSAKVLVIDEVHAYDEYMTTILERLLKWCRALQIPVILLSATLSQRQKLKLVQAYGRKLEQDDKDEEYPLITIIPMDEDQEVRPVHVSGQNETKIALKIYPGTMTDPVRAAELAVKLTENGGCACLLMNTVADAQAAYKELEHLLPKKHERHLFHARFTAKRRQEIENNVVQLFGKDAGKNGNPPRPHRAVLVATQVVEQSLDLDFDVMISQLAPVDLLLQRVGRLWRHNQQERDRHGLERALHVLMPDESIKEFGSSETVYGKYVLMRTASLLQGKEEIVLPRDFRPLVDECYQDESMIDEVMLSTEESEAFDRQLLKDGKSRNAARLVLIPEPRKRYFSLASDDPPLQDNGDEIDFRPRTREDSGTCSVLILEDPELLNAARATGKPDRAMLKELFLHKVDIPLWWIDKAEPIEGYESLFDGEGWLRGVKILPMVNGEWRGKRGGKSICLKNDCFLGVKISKD